MNYFETDCLDVSIEARRHNRTFVETGAMVLLSIQQPWQGMPAQFAHVREHGRDSVYLFGAKRKGFDYLTEHAQELREYAVKCFYEHDLDALVMRYLDIPCLGLAKASFLAQLTINQGACLDIHNLRRLGLAPSDVLLPKTLTNKTKAKKVSAYNSAWQAVGDSAYWWNSWCDNMVGTSYNKRLTSGAQVSALHRMPIE